MQTDIHQCSETAQASVFSDYQQIHEVGVPNRFKAYSVLLVEHLISFTINRFTVLKRLLLRMVLIKTHVAGVVNILE